MSILLATTRPEALTGFTEALARATGRDVAVTASGAETLAALPVRAPKLVVIDENLPDNDPLALVREIMMVSAMTLTAVVTDMPEDEFHEAAEGYGILMPLPPNPGDQDARELATRLSAL